jgi:hypothetical protein
VVLSSTDIILLLLFHFVFAQLFILFDTFCAVCDFALLSIVLHHCLVFEFLFVLHSYWILLSRMLSNVAHRVATSMRHTTCTTSSSMLCRIHRQSMTLPVLSSSLISLSSSSHRRNGTLSASTRQPKRALRVTTMHTASFPMAHSYVASANVSWLLYPSTSTNSLTGARHHFSNAAPPPLDHGHSHGSPVGPPATTARSHQPDNKHSQGNQATQRSDDHSHSHGKDSGGHGHSHGGMAELLHAPPKRLGEKLKVKSVPTAEDDPEHPRQKLTRAATKMYFIHYSSLIFVSTKHVQSMVMKWMVCIGCEIGQSRDYWQIWG